jgi:hypothetical protein
MKKFASQDKIRLVRNVLLSQTSWKSEVCCMSEMKNEITKLNDEVVQINEKLNKTAICKGKLNNTLYK